ncbi:MAG: hypothetical protein HYX90_00360 [Chloroflexi bacterium]|nr:hypothetical protein [Chloroflexota bacterium]
MYDVITAEEVGTPAVALVNKGFAADAASAASSKGMPVRIVTEDVPSECSIDERVRSGVVAVMDDIVSTLTKPLTAEEEHPKSKEARWSRIVFKGSLEEVNRFFYKRGFGDGLPLIPPTEEAVKEMLTGTDLPADHVVAKIIPRLGKATVEKIAINAVMAGALPTYMPLLIAAVHILGDDPRRCEFHLRGVSTGAWAPFWVINGPVRNDIHVNSGTGALSPGNIANAVIGRAMGLIVKNVGGIRAGIEDMGTLGNPGKYSMVTGEDEEGSPWEPLHIEQGFNKGDSTISLIFPNCYSQVWPYGTDDKGILSGVIYNLIPGRAGLFCLMLPSYHAKTLADKGWTKDKVAAYIADYGSVPAYRHPDYYGRTPVCTTQGPPANPMDQMPLFRKEWIRCVVAGGPGDFMGLIAGICRDSEWVTKKAELPANWEKLVKKYQDVVPTYMNY